MGGHAEIQEVWEELRATMKRREESLGEASKLQGFLRDLDDFQAWLSRTQTTVASEDTPTSLAEAERLLAQHEAIKNEVDNYKEDYEKMRDTGAEVSFVSILHIRKKLYEFILLSISDYVYGIYVYDVYIVGFIYDFYI